MKINTIIKIFLFLSILIFTNNHQAITFKNLIGDDNKSFLIQSNGIVEGQFIDDKYTPQGEDINPDIYWDEKVIPAGTKSFGLIVEDPDAPVGIWYHWIVINISSEKTNIPENSVPGEQITNSWGIKKYKGPSPPKNQTHRYYFKLYALSVEKIHANNANEFYTEVGKYKLGESYIMGKYKK